MSVTTRGSVLVHAARETVWAALNDVDCLKLCIPQCRSLARSALDQFTLSVSVKLGPVALVVDGFVEITDRDPPNAYTLIGRGEAGIAGKAAGTARIKLIEARGGCRLHYDIEAEPRGPFAALGTVFITGVATRLADHFATTFAEIVGMSGLPTGATLVRDGRA